MKNVLITSKTHQLETRRCPLLIRQKPNTNIKQRQKLQNLSPKVGDRPFLRAPLMLVCWSLNHAETRLSTKNASDFVTQNPNRQIGNYCQNNTSQELENIS